ncbi:CotH kinase family protein [Aquimarina brevivitae]|uniref:CotH kinase family protein n=1 Tax=Aquimarina brevivitae TaxID=323412 RepID=UPI0013EEB89D|nr:CotH kinase family protein [Aquimarina brevivitae]
MNHHILIYRLLFLVCSTSLTLYGQHPKVIQVDSLSYGIDYKHRLIVYSDALTDSLSKTIKNVTLHFNSDLQFTIPTDSTKYNTSFEAKGYKLYVTRLPVITIAISKSIVDEPKRPSKLTYYHKGTSISSIVGIELRGNISQTFPKKTYDLEFWKDESGKENRDVSFGGLRKDDDWILDGLYNEPLRVRSYFAAKLWLQLHSPTYRNNPNAKSGFDLCFTEVFINGRYQGVFALSEQVDDKLLQLQKPVVNAVQGVLYKASSYSGGTDFTKLTDYDNLFPHWGGFEMEFPIRDYTSHWEPLYDLTDIVINASKDDFKNKIDQQIQLNNAIDYFLFVNLLRATDNLGKNYYIATAQKASPFFIIPWDLDGVLGTIIDGRHIPTTNDILSNGLFDRLSKENPKGYNQKLAERWQQLRATTFSNDSLLKMITNQYQRFENEQIYEREYAVWPTKKTKEEEFDYIKNWLQERLLFLDGYFKDSKND